MNFSDLENAANELTQMINQNLQRKVVDQITLETPTPPPDELHFIRLVVWCYAFFFEAASDVMRECKALMKQGDPSRTNRHDRIMTTINNLRTYHVHNLPPSKSNDYKRATAEAWLAESGTANKFESACKRLCEEAATAISEVSSIWVAATKDSEDAQQLFARVRESLDRTWAVHELDKLVKEVAIEIGLENFDANLFRKKYDKEWREAGMYFQDKQAGEEGVRRAIRGTMQQIYGTASGATRD